MTNQPKPLLLPKDDQQLVIDGVKTQFRSVLDTQGLSMSQIGLKKDLIQFVKHQVGDVFYLQEEFYETDRFIMYSNDTDIPLRPASQMPIKHARYFYKVTKVRVELLEDISNEDCIADGIIDMWESQCSCDTGQTPCNNCEEREFHLSDKLANKWNSTHPDGQKFEDGIYVEVVTFKLIEKEIK